jgi:hypothetical protein
MNQYKIDYTIRNGGVQRQEIISARSDYEARRTLESRYRQGEIHIVCVTKVA